MTKLAHLLVFFAISFVNIPAPQHDSFVPPPPPPHVCEEPLVSVMFIDTYDEAMVKRQDIFYKIILLRPNHNIDHAVEIADAVYAITQHYKLDYNVILSIMRIESNFNPKALSPVGAIGLMQVMPFWASKPGSDCEGQDLWDINDNVDCGTKVYLHYLKMYGNQRLALSAYNRGPYLINQDLREGRDPIQAYVYDIKKVEKRLSLVTRVVHEFHDTQVAYLQP